MVYCKYCMYQSRSPHLRCPLQQTHPFSFTTFVLLTVLFHLFFPFFTLDIPTILSSDTFDNLRHFPTIDFGNHLIPIDLGSLLLLFTSQPSASRSVIAHELLRPSPPITCIRPPLSAGHASLTRLFFSVQPIFHISPSLYLSRFVRVRVRVSE